MDKTKAKQIFKENKKSLLHSIKLTARQGKNMCSSWIESGAYFNDDDAMRLKSVMEEAGYGVRVEISAASTFTKRGYNYILTWTNEEE